MTPHIETVPNPQVGSFYLVPCVQLFINLHKKKPDWRWQPVIGPWHEDEDIGTPDHHFHLDIRFMEERFLSRLGPTIGRIHPARASVPVPTVPDPTIAPKITYRRIKMRRPMPEFPGPCTAKFIVGLEVKFEHHQLKCRTCPHRGMPLDGLPQDEQGRVICNGHGLRWNLNTGKLSPRSAI
jgi:hypothetical protein